MIIWLLFNNIVQIRHFCSNSTFFIIFPPFTRKTPKWIFNQNIHFSPPNKWILSTFKWKYCIFFLKNHKPTNPSLFICQTKSSYLYIIYTNPSTLHTPHTLKFWFVGKMVLIQNGRTECSPTKIVLIFFVIPHLYHKQKGFKFVTFNSQTP